MTVRRFILLALFGALLVLGGLWLSRSVSAQELGLIIGAPRATVGEEMSVDIEARDMRATGLGEAAAATPTSIAATPTAFPHTGAGGHPGSDDLLHALIALMSGVGIAAVITFALLLLRARRI